MNLYAWAARWAVPLEAVIDLQRQMGMEGTIPPMTPGWAPPATETGVQNVVRLEAGRKRVLLWRNNNGALQDAEGRWVRYGLANDSKAVNERIKSADLIGIRPVVVNHDMVGQTLGVFVSREIKPPGWQYTNTDREQAQKRWMDLVLSAGGDACFATGEGTL